MEGENDSNINLLFALFLNYSFFWLPFAEFSSVVKVLHAWELTDRKNKFIGASQGCKLA
jgi:hypothetical protein